MKTASWTQILADYQFSVIQCIGLNFPQNKDFALLGRLPAVELLRYHDTDQKCLRSSADIFYPITLLTLLYRNT